ncbi:MAG TPA: aldehyde dehydrogenase family protein, partial [Bacteroidota bacterium]|nr:aldehyde dehydrogenase family protein [Bacteroidota bacterium]
MPADRDLQSIQEARDLVSRAKQAQLAFRSFSQERVDAIVKAMADAGFAAAERLGKLANGETGFGKAADKKKKNEFATRRVWESIKDLKTVGVIHEDKERKIIEIGEPMGVVAALVPSTNPTSTMMFKAIISVKGRNAIVASPHPRSVNCTLEAANIITKAAEGAGAPPGLINCMSIPTTEGTNELMRHKLTAVILATGSTPMVRAAYSAGKPAYGVGPGNVPSFIERTANVRKAVADIVSGKMFDWGVLCSTESAAILDNPIRKIAIEEFKRRGAYFVSPEEKDRLSRLMFDNRGTINPDIVGKAPTVIASTAGFDVPHDTTVLVAELPGVGREFPLSREKLSPVLSLFTVNGWQEGCELCIKILEFGGMGHSMVIHSTDSEVVLKFGLEKPAFRVLVNTQAALGAVGYTNELLPSMTLGPGTFGGSIISENVSAKHLINVKRLAFETRPIHPPEQFIVNPPMVTQSGVAPHALPQKKAPATPGKSWMDEIEERIRLKAGNAVSVQQPAHQSFGAGGSAVSGLPGNTSPQAGQPASSNSEPAVEKRVPIQQAPEKTESLEKKPEFGTGISAEQIDK